MFSVVGFRLPFPEQSCFATFMIFLSDVDLNVGLMLDYKYFSHVVLSLTTQLISLRQSQAVQLRS